MDEAYEPETTASETSTILTTSTKSADSIYEAVFNVPELSPTELLDIEEEMYDLMDEYMKQEIIHISSPNFYKKFIKDITTEFYEYWLECGICDEDDFDDIEEIVEQLIEVYFDICQIPLRSNYDTCTTTNMDKPLEVIANKINYLKSIPQAKQKSIEWYTFRYNLITASNLWKVFASEAQRNSLIYDKCKPLDAFKSEQNNTYTQGTLHWGVKYEPVSIHIYEHMYQTKVGDFGCIQHKTYQFIGASPDGINIDTNNIEKYGRMIEIKNIFNREITGVPKQEYWIQTQIQMETCDLDECDFVETRIKEFENATAFYEDTAHEYKGVILYFVHRMNMTNQTNLSVNEMNTPVYKYMPLDVSLTNNKEEIDRWIAQMKENHSEELILFNTIYWYMDELSCVLIKRNPQWFESAVPKIKELWDIILKERVEGYSHRAAKKKIKSEVVVQINPDTTDTTHIIKNLPLSNHICLVKLSS
jgi:hypothetical protein